MSLSTASCLVVVQGFPLGLTPVHGPCRCLGRAHVVATSPAAGPGGVAVTCPVTSAGSMSPAGSSLKPQPQKVHGVAAVFPPAPSTTQGALLPNRSLHAQQQVLGAPLPRVRHTPGLFASLYSLSSSHHTAKPHRDGAAQPRTQPRGPFPSPRAAGGLVSAPLLENAVHLLQHMAQALVLGRPAGQGDLKKAGLAPQGCTQRSWPPQVLPA